MLDRRILLRASKDGDDVAFLHRVRRDVHLLAIHQEVAVADQLTGLRPRRRQSQPIDDVVEPPFQELEQRHAGYAARALGGLEVAAELILEHPVDALHLLLLAQLQAVASELRLPRLAVLSGREIALFDGALLRVAPFPLEEQLHRLTATETTNRTNITSHQISLKNRSLLAIHNLHASPLRWSAPVVRDRRHVAD